MLTEHSPMLRSRLYYPSSHARLAALDVADGRREQRALRGKMILPHTS